MVRPGFRDLEYNRFPSWRSFVFAIRISGNNLEQLYHSTTVYNYFGMAKKRIRLIYAENPIWVGNEIGKKGPVNQMAGLVKSSEIW